MFSFKLFSTRNFSGGYGAKELKYQIGRNTVKGFFAALAKVSLFFLLYFTLGNADKKVAPFAKDIPWHPGKIIVEDFDLKKPDQFGYPQLPDNIEKLNFIERAGKPIPVPAAEISEDAAEFASIDNLHVAKSTAGDISDPELLNSLTQGNNGNDLQISGSIETDEPAPDEFIPVEKEPGVDLRRLQDLIEYPVLAQRADIEGRVIVKALIGKYGELKKTIIIHSDSELLNDAAVNALRAYGTFTPAIQNGRPVACWISIPVHFRLMK